MIFYLGQTLVTVVNRVTKRFFRRWSGVKPSVPCGATCASTALVKAGHNGSGTQQFLCKACGAHRVLKAKGPATDPERRATVLRAVEVERLSLRAAERVFGVARQTVAKWLEKKPLNAHR